MTPALTPTEILPFLQAGFRSREQLYVLVHHLGDPVPVRTVPGVVLRRGRNGDVPGALGIDRDAFDDFWRFDGEALADACKATPQFRFRVAVNQAPLRPKHARAETGGVVPAGTLLGYCITGRSRSQGFLQRLAVAPAAWGQGIGRTLVFDALHWLLHRHARSCIVNTQESNGRAATLYKTCGFEMSPTGLYVLTRPLGSDVMA